jgi:hypothetical protein
MLLSRTNGDLFPRSYGLHGLVLRHRDIITLDTDFLFISCRSGHVARMGEIKNAQETLYSFLIGPMHDTCPAHLTLFDLVIKLIFDEAEKTTRNTLA